MGAWESLASGWADFWDHRGAAGVAGINFLVNLVAVFMVSLSGVPLFSLLSQPAFGQPAGLPGHHSLLAVGIAGAVTALVIAPFVIAATPTSLIESVSDQFSITRYFQNGARFFWRALGFLWLSTLVLIILMLVSALIIFLLSLLFGLILGKPAGIIGTVVGFLLLILPWISVFGIYLITMLKYLTSKERGLGVPLSSAVSMVKERFWATSGIILIFIALSLVAAIISTILKYIPVIGIIVGMFVSSAANVIGLLAIMVFTGLIPGKR